MYGYDFDDAPQSSGCVRGALILVVTAVLLGAAFLYIAKSTASKLNPFSGISNPLAAQPTVINTSRPTVIQSIKAVNKMEATTVIADKFIEAGQPGGTLYNLFLGDKLLLIANGEVVAGFDFSKLKDQDVQVTGDRVVTMTLPPPEVLSSKLNNDRTYVYERTTGVATRGNAGLESEARRVAELEILRGACETGILDRANLDGQRNMEQLLKGLGFTQITVNTQPGTCTLPGGAPIPARTP